MIVREREREKDVKSNYAPSSLQTLVTATTTNPPPTRQSPSPPTSTRRHSIVIVNPNTVILCFFYCQINELEDKTFNHAPPSPHLPATHLPPSPLSAPLTRMPGHDACTIQQAHSVTRGTNEVITGAQIWESRIWYVTNPTRSRERGGGGENRRNALFPTRESN